MLDAPEVKEPESVKMPSPLTFDKMFVVNEVVCSQSTLVGVSDHEKNQSTKGEGRARGM